VRLRLEWGTRLGSLLDILENLFFRNGLVGGNGGEDGV
jgi:hypothetical protein